MANVLRALIVDDSMFIRDLLRRQLTAHGLLCESAANGEDGLMVLRESAARGERFDLALLDLNMPVMNGFEMLVALRREGFDLKVMMVTTEADRESILKALDAGADEYLMKPFDESALAEKIAMLGLPFEHALESEA